MFNSTLMLLICQLSWLKLYLVPRMVMPRTGLLATPKVVCQIMAISLHEEGDECWIMMWRC